MKSPVKVIMCTIFALVFLAGCSSGGGTFEGIKLIPSATGIEQSTIGKNLRVVYMSQGGLADVCDAQANIVVAESGYNVSEAIRNETTYMTGTFTADKNTLTLMCSQQEENAGIKVTMTLNKGG